MELNDKIQNIRAWNTLKEYISKIHDDKTRKIYYTALLSKATEEYGFNPQTAKVSKTDNSVVLDAWEKEFVEDIHKTQMYQLDVRAEKRKKEHKEALARAKLFIQQGGSYSDLPDDLKNEHTAKLWLEAMDMLLDEINEQIANIG